MDLTIHFPLINAHATILDKRLFRVVQTGGAVTIPIVRDLVIVPDWDPREVLMREKQVKVGAIGSNTTSVVVEGENFALWLNRAGGGRCAILI